MPNNHDGMIHMKSSEVEGSFGTPGFGSSDYRGNFYSRAQSLHYVVNTTTIGQTMTNRSALVITVQSEGTWSFMLQAARLQWYRLLLNHSAAEEFCVKRGGHLASVESQEEQDMIQKLGVSASEAWLGGKKGDDGRWFWLDGKTWQYQNWAISNLNYWANASGRCAHLSGWANGMWIDDDCDNSRSFICATNKQIMSGNHTFIMEKTSLLIPTFHFWWKHTPSNQSRQTRGLQISWRIENGGLPDWREYVIRDLSGNATTPGFGSIAPPEFYKERHEYTAVIELPYNITDVIGNGAFAVEVDIYFPDEEVELLTTNLNYEFNHVEMKWTDAEAFCVSKGGHLASVSTPSEWERLQEFYAEVFPEGKDYDDFLYLWLGGTDQHTEGE